MDSIKHKFKVGDVVKSNMITIIPEIGTVIALLNTDKDAFGYDVLFDGTSIFLYEDEIDYTLYFKREQILKELLDE